MACAWSSELVHVQTLATQTPVKGFNPRISHGFAGAIEVRLYATAIRPFFESAGLEFGPMIDGDGARPPGPRQGCDRAPDSPDRPTFEIPPLKPDSIDSSYRPPSRPETGCLSAKVSWTRTMLRRSCGPTGTGAGPRCSAMCFRRRTRMRSCKPSSR